jgi:hypothetical protein
LDSISTCRSHAPGGSLIVIGPGTGCQGQLILHSWSQSDKRQDGMAMTIDGFSIGPHTATDIFLFWRVAAPQHEYIIKIDSGHIELLQIVPTTVNHGDPEVDAMRFKDDVLNAAKKYQELLSGR